VVERIHRDVYASLGEPALRKAVEATGMQIAPTRSLAELERLYEAEIERYQAIARAIKLQPQ
jgi:hypothetical protein